MKKYWIIITSIIVILLVVSACAPQADPIPTDDLPTFTVEQLAEFDGKEGRKAYVAIDNLVYDLTGVPQWAQGMHQGLQAGKVLTNALGTAPHGRSVLTSLKVVGKLE